VARAGDAESVIRPATVVINYPRAICSPRASAVCRADTAPAWRRPAELLPVAAGPEEAAAAVAPDVRPVPAAAADGKQVAAAVVGAAPGAPLLVPAAVADGKQVAAAVVGAAPGVRSRGLAPPAVAAAVPDAPWSAPERTSFSAAVAAVVAEVATASPCSAAADR
jgi:hypothetical protein